VEILIATPALPNLIREGKTTQILSMIQTGREIGMQSMDQSLIELIKKNIITTSVAREKAADFKTFERAGIRLGEI